MPTIGTLYISSNYVCYTSDPPLVLPFLDIVHIRRSAATFGAQLAFHIYAKPYRNEKTEINEFTFATIRGEEGSFSSSIISFCSLTNCAIAYRLLVELWTACAAKVQRTNALRRRELENIASPDELLLSLDETQRIQERLLTAAETITAQQELRWLTETYKLPPNQKVCFQSFLFSSLVSKYSSYAFCSVRYSLDETMRRCPFIFGVKVRGGLVLQFVTKELIR